MYALMCRLLPRPWADLVTILWYAALIVGIYALWGAPQAEFRYIHI